MDWSSGPIWHPTKHRLNRRWREKFGAFASSLTDDEAALFVSFVECVSSDEVAGFGRQPFESNLNASFQMLSNLSRSQHDEAKAIISNIRS